ncbi:MAG: LysR family transcriptional regulator [Advenella sp.]|uniref:LysR family transcriptional regulator n=1 Tax=Advenella sp. S44 TaxID=1982755 RepID=UPI001F5BDEFD|nr:LysR family transcriptional regulator [Advenella sp. S44]
MRHLTLLLHIGELGALTRVAQHMGTSQPAVTHALAELEDMFGVALFERTGRGMTPTAAGQVLLARARSMINDVSALSREMVAVNAGRVAHLHVGAIPFIPGQMLSAALENTVSARQRMTVTIHDGTSRSLMTMLREHALDFVIGRASASMDMTGLQQEVLYYQSPRLITNRELAARLGQRRPDWRHLAELDWILEPAPAPLREQVADMFLSAGVVPPQPLIESLSAKLTGEIIAARGHVVSIVPNDIAEELVRIAGVAVVPWSLQWALSPIALFSLKDRNTREVDLRFTQSLKRYCEKHRSAYSQERYQY